MCKTTASKEAKPALAICTHYSLKKAEVVVTGAQCVTTLSKEWVFGDEPVRFVNQSQRISCLWQRTACQWLVNTGN
jgi:hypothetical protein